MKLRLLLAVVAGLLVGTPAGRARLSRLLGRVPGAEPSQHSPAPVATPGTPTPTPTPTPASAPTLAPTPTPTTPTAPVPSPLDAPPVPDNGALPAHAPLGPDSTGAEVAIDLFEHGGTPPEEKA